MSDNIIGIVSSTKQVNVKMVIQSPKIIANIISSGPAGKQGLPGIPGLDAVGYVHSQIQASNIWIINHPLNKFASVTIVDSGGSVVIGDISYESINKIILTFSAEFSGEAYLN